MGLVTMHIIVEVDKGLHEARVFDDEQLVGEYFERKVTEKGFRKMNHEVETLSDYYYAFHEWEDSPECTYDKADWELHWWSEVPVNFDPHDVEEQEDDIDPENIYGVLGHPDSPSLPPIPAP